MAAVIVSKFNVPHPQTACTNSTPLPAPACPSPDRARLSKTAAKLRLPTLLRWFKPCSAEGQDPDQGRMLPMALEFGEADAGLTGGEASGVAAQGADAAAQRTKRSRQR